MNLRPDKRKKVMEAYVMGTLRYYIPWMVLTMTKRSVQEFIERILYEMAKKITNRGTTLSRLDASKIIDTKSYFVTMEKILNANVFKN